MSFIGGVLENFLGMSLTRGGIGKETKDIGSKRSFLSDIRDYTNQLNTNEEANLTSKGLALNVVNHDSTLQSFVHGSLDRNVASKNFMFDKIKPELQDDALEALSKMVRLYGESNYSYQLYKDQYRNYLKQSHVSTTDIDKNINLFVPYGQDLILEQYKSNIPVRKFFNCWAWSLPDISIGCDMVLNGWAKIYGENDNKGILTYYQSPFSMDYDKLSLLAATDKSLSSQNQSAVYTTFDVRNIAALMNGRLGNTLVGPFGGDGPVPIMMQKDLITAMNTFRKEAFLFLEKFDNPNSVIPIVNDADSKRLYTAREYAETKWNVTNKDDITLNHLVHYFCAAAASSTFRTSPQQNVGFLDEIYNGIGPMTEFMQAAIKIGIDLPESVYFKSDGRTKRDVEQPSHDIKPIRATYHKSIPEKINGRNIFYVRFALTAIANLRHEHSSNREHMVRAYANIFVLDNGDDARSLENLSKAEFDRNVLSEFSPQQDPKIVSEKEVSSRVKGRFLGIFGSGKKSISEVLKPNEVLEIDYSQTVLKFEERFSQMSGERTGLKDIASAQTEAASIQADKGIKSLSRSGAIGRGISRLFVGAVTGLASTVLTPVALLANTGLRIAKSEKRLPVSGLGKFLYGSAALYIAGKSGSQYIGNDVKEYDKIQYNSEYFSKDLASREAAGKKFAVETLKEDAKVEADGKFSYFLNGTYVTPDEGSIITFPAGTKVFKYEDTGKIIGGESEGIITTKDNSRLPFGLNANKTYKYQLDANDSKVDFTPKNYIQQESAITPANQNNVETQKAEVKTGNDAGNAVKTGSNTSYTKKVEEERTVDPEDYVKKMKERNK